MTVLLRSVVLAVLLVSGVANALGVCLPSSPGSVTFFIWDCPCNGAPCTLGDPRDRSTCTLGDPPRGECAGHCTAVGGACGDPGPCDDSTCVADPAGPVEYVSSGLRNLPICEQRTKCGGGGAARPKNGSERTCRLGGPSSVGDPVGLSDGASYFSWVDFSLDTYAGRLEFQRSYTSNDQLWGQAGDLAGIAPPFGSSWTNAQSANWSHSLFSFVVERTSTGLPATWTVRRRDGSILQFDGCSPTSGCFAKPRGEALEADAKLYRAGSAFTLFDAGRRYVYGLQDGARWFLTAIATDEFMPSSPRWIVQAISYAAPPASCVGASGRFVETATLADGRVVRFSYALRSANGGGSSQCVLVSVRLESAAGVSTLVSYAYSGNSAGRISDASFLDGSNQHFDYPPVASPVTGPFRVLRNGSTLLQHDVVAGRVQTIWESVDGAQLRQTWSLSAPSGCAPLTSCTTATARNVFVGDGSGTPTTRAWEAAAQSVTWSAVPRTASWGAAAAADTWSWREWGSTGGGGGSQLIALTPELTENSVGVSTRYEWQTASAPQTRELQATTDALGRRTEFDFVAGDTNRSPTGVAQLQTVERRPSVLNYGAYARTITNWDTANNRVSSIVHAGWTWEFTPPSTWSPVERYVATFYRTDAPALGRPADPRGRIQQVDGPCFVSSPAAMGCNSETPYEVVVYTYGSTLGADQDHVVAVDRFPNVVLPANSTQPVWGSSLRTSFDKYDAFGHPGQSVDPNGVTTDFVWTDGRLHQAVVSDANGTLGSWEYVYDLDKLTAVRDPDGAWTVWCYRDSFDRSTGCDYASAFSPVVRAHVIAPEPTGAGFTEAAVFEYGLDGRLRRTAYLDESGERRSQTEERDPLGNPTYSRSGDLPGWVNRTTRLFDSAGRLRGLGEPFASAPDFCAGFDIDGNPASALCTGFVYDKADRLTGVSAAGATHCLDYDAHDQLDRSRSGCSSGCASCAAGTERSWQHDDFGNVVSFSSEAMQGLTRMEWTARGTLAVRQTPMMESANAWLRYKYDGAGRLLELLQEHQGGQPDRLLSQVWDEDTSGGSCAVAENTRGRLAWRTDAAGDTVFSYTALGQTQVEALTDGQQRCLRTFYNWGASGKLYSVTYPFGRTIGYEYAVFPSGTGVSPRVSAVNVRLHDGTNWLWTPLISGVTWEPFGGLRFYRVRDSGQKQWASVDYRQGNTALDMAPTCPEDALEPPDGTGRPWKLVVQRHGEGAPPEADTTSGEHVYVATYGYLGQYLRNERRCLLDDGDPVMVEYATTQGTGSLLEQTVRNGNGDRRPGHRQYDVSGFGERFLEVLDFSWAHGGSGAPPQLWRTVGPPVGSQDVEFLDPALGPDRSTIETREYDIDGRVQERIALTDSSQLPLWRQSLRPGHSASGGGGGLDSVYRTVTTASGTYEYFYDGNNRRRKKVYPSGVADDFYYASGGSQLYVDVGNDEPWSPTLHPTEEYVWLGGQVVAIIRGKLDRAYDRLADEGTDCQRNGDVQFGTTCGVYYPVMDVTGRPAVVLDAELRVAGVGESDPFGHVNRVQVLASTDHSPYADNYHNVNGPLLREFAIDPWAPTSTEVRFKLHFYGVDVEGRGADDVWLEDTRSGTGIPFSSPLERCSGVPDCGYHLGEVSTYWVQPSENGYAPVNLWFVSSWHNYAPESEAWTDKWPFWGVALDRVDYRRSELGAKAWWPSMRLPGQYYDEETDLFENWNRYYDATTGRYLSPEPLLQSPNFVMAQAKQGLQTPAYAYAQNDPLMYTDPSGRNPAVIPIAVGVAVGEALVFTGVIAAGVYCIGTHCLGDLDDLLGRKKQTREVCRDEPKASPTPMGCESIPTTWALTWAAILAKCGGQQPCGMQLHETQVFCDLMEQCGGERALNGSYADVWHKWCNRR